jgi:hypothetical protein
MSENSTGIHRRVKRPRSCDKDVERIFLILTVGTNREFCDDYDDGQEKADEKEVAEKDGIEDNCLQARLTLTTMTSYKHTECPHSIYVCIYMLSTS